MSTCERCNGSGFEDSGGVQPWGEQILVECECRLMERNMDESRKAFEKWYQLNWGHTEDNEDSMFDVSSCHGVYKRLGVGMAYQAWQASREAIEVDAPAEPFYPMPKENSPTDHYHYGRQSIISKVRAAGIKVKE